MQEQKALKPALHHHPYHSAGVVNTAGVVNSANILSRCHQCCHFQGTQVLMESVEVQLFEISLPFSLQLPCSEAEEDWAD